MSNKQGEIPAGKGEKWRKNLRWNYYTLLTIIVEPSTSRWNRSGQVGCGTGATQFKYSLLHLFLHDPKYYNNAFQSGIKLIVTLAMGSIKAKKGNSWSLRSFFNNKRENGLLPLRHAWGQLSNPCWFFRNVEFGQETTLSIFRGYEVSLPILLISKDRKPHIKPKRFSRDFYIFLAFFELC